VADQKSSSGPHSAIAQLAAYAREALKRVRVPQDASEHIHRQALTSPDEYGAAAHHAAWLQSDLAELAATIDSLSDTNDSSLGAVIAASIKVGRRFALLEDAQRDEPLDLELKRLVRRELKQSKIGANNRARAN
jgi:hypothetical protein